MLDINPLSSDPLASLTGEQLKAYIRHYDKEIAASDDPSLISRYKVFRAVYLREQIERVISENPEIIEKKGYQPRHRASRSAPETLEMDAVRDWLSDNEVEVSQKDTIVDNTELPPWLLR
jgi:hypothetical protein